MSSDLGLLFDSNKRFPSPDRLNIKCLVVGTGNDIQAIPLASLENGMAFSVTADSTDLALRAGVVYVLKAGVMTSINAGTHTHMNSNDGGKLTQVFVKGTYDLWHRNYQNPNDFKDITTATNGTATMTTSGYLELMANASLANNVINAYDRGLVYDFAKPLSFYARLRLADVATSYLTRFGFNGDTAETVTPTTASQIVLEGCDSCSTNKVTIVSANNTIREKDETVLTDLVTDTANYYIEHIPTELKILYKRNNTTFVTKDNAIPTTGVPNRARLIIAGIQTKNTTAKRIDIYGFIANGTVAEDSWNLF